MNANGEGDRHFLFSVETVSVEDHILCLISNDGFRSYPPMETLYNCYLI